MKAYKKFLAATIAVAGLSSAAHADIIIGAAGPLTNAESIFGVTWMNGMEIAIRQVNDAGGINGEKSFFSATTTMAIQSKAH